MKEGIEGSTVHGILVTSCRREALSVWKDLKLPMGIYMELFETAAVFLSCLEDAEEETLLCS